MKKMIISPSLLAADFSCLDQQIRRVADAGAQFLHLDVMDGDFVPNLSFGAPVMTSIRPKTNLIFDVHLMVREPIRFIDSFIKAGADIITVHYEACKDVLSTIKAIREKEVRVGLAISPKTPIENILPFLPFVDLCLIMTVEPGKGGQKFMADMMPKVKAVRRYADDHNLPLYIEVDGGISVDTIGIASEAGANVFVAGTAIFGAKQMNLTVAKMKESIEKHPFRRS